MQYLTMQDLVELHRAVSAEYGGTQAHPGLVTSQFGLVSAVQRPQITMLGRDAWPAFSDKAAVLAFALLDLKPFQGGNRRVALAAILAFCELNHKAIDARQLDEKAAENLLKRVSSYRDTGIPAESVFKELRETLGRAIVAA